MADTSPTSDRAELLADIAEMYYLGGTTQAVIAEQVGVTRSMISRMLTEARQNDIVRIQIRRPIGMDHELGHALTETFGLAKAHVIVSRTADGAVQLDRLGEAAARVLSSLLAPDLHLGLAWGTAVRSTVKAIQPPEPIPLKIVQLVGALGARIVDYDGHALVQQLAERFGGEGYFLHAPFLMESPETVQALSNVSSIQETLELGRTCDIALVGIGSTEEKNSSFFQAGYISIDQLRGLQAGGAVGDVCGRHFDSDGKPVGQNFSNRTVTISSRSLMNIPIRIGVAGGRGKVVPILGALRSGYVNHLVTDSFVARELLEMHDRS